MSPLKRKASAIDFELKPEEIALVTIPGKVTGYFPPTSLIALEESVLYPCQN